MIKQDIDLISKISNDLINISDMRMITDKSLLQSQINLEHSDG